jgi:hypothetical protein
MPCSLLDESIHKDQILLPFSSTRTSTTVQVATKRHTLSFAMSTLPSAGVFFGIQHSSIPGYLRGHSSTQTYTYGQALDAIVNLSVVLSREEVLTGEEACFTSKFWPLPGRSTTTLKKAIWCLAGQEALSATGASPVFYTAATVPLDVLSLLVVGGYVPLARDPGESAQEALIISLTVPLVQTTTDDGSSASSPTCARMRGR